MNIITGKQKHAIRLVLYGVEGIGKTTFASHAPDPLYIDTEGSTKDIDVKRIDPAPGSWTELLQYIQEVRDSQQQVCKTLVLDTADWAEKLCMKQVCDKYSKAGIEDFGYGKGYTYVYEEFGKMLNLLSDLIKRGINVIILAHATLRKYEQPEETGSYDRYTMKLVDSPKTSVANMVKEWADIVLFANYNINVVEIDGKKKAQGGQRVMYTTHTPSWDAKNRYGLPDKLPLDFESIKFLFDNEEVITKSFKIDDSVYEDEGLPFEVDGPDEPAFDPQITDPDFPKKLIPIMINQKVTDLEIREAVAAKGICPVDMPVSKYPEDFVNGLLIAQFEKVYEQILINRKES